MTKLPIIESYWVEENHFLAGEYPASYDPTHARLRIEAFLEAGIRTFIDLTLPHELVPYEPILREQAELYDLDLSYHRFAICDHGVPSRETMMRILDTIDESIQKDKPVYIHCWGGVGRTGITVGCYLVRHGLTAEEALLRVASLYATRPQNHFLTTSPETPAQFDFVRKWHEIPSAKHRSKQNFCEG
jgi:hypothetical protein